MIKTSYFANYRNFPEDYIILNISHFKKVGKDCKIRSCEVLAPPITAFVKYKQGKIDNKQFKEEYIKYVSTDKRVAIALNKLCKDTYHNYLLLCCEGPDSFCHRHLLASYIKEKFGIEVEEL